MMMTVKDEWVRAAIMDDGVVVELLVRLKQAQVAPPALKSALPALKWGIRQPRSRPMLVRCDGKRDGYFNVSSRCSPTTPLCWSGGSGDATPSAADCFEETSTHVLRSPPVAPSRSKGSASSETNRKSTKRSRRKKTSAEPKEEENHLLKGRVHLKKEIASTHGSTNENLKRIRLDLNLDTAKNSSLIADELEKVPSCQPSLRVPFSFDSTLPLLALDDDRKPPLDSCKSNSSENSVFILPDLNMMPTEEDSGPET